MLQSTAFLPVSDVNAAFEALQKRSLATSQLLFIYFVDNEIGRLSAANGARQKSKFNIYSWSDNGVSENQQCSWMLEEQLR